ncbi:hypothetical protein EXIGLDRAFT_176255 [Exidia glandulosa HHB12029]|uniref:JmjC domain-containing protein n=1 Tax=Exidia glandulosa HHB12029 TaxID=1314781 RepID=A0A165N1Z6_EXIGL|nr:hypothetical protein EXIGLDRAFT_176255 [Exidia glandulosa HHB12029]
MDWFFDPSLTLSERKARMHRWLLLASRVGDDTQVPRFNPAGQNAIATGQEWPEPRPTRNDSRVSTSLAQPSISSSISTPEYQKAACVDLPLETSLACRACRSGAQDDECRFRGFRLISPCLSGAIAAVSFPEPPSTTHSLSEDCAPLPHSEKIHVVAKLTAVAQLLLPALKPEIELFEHPGLLYQRPSAGFRTTCDKCLTSIFSGAWLCTCCGFESCLDCYSAVIRLPSDGGGDLSNACASDSHHFRPLARLTRQELISESNRMSAWLESFSGVPQDSSHVPCGDSQSMRNVEKNVITVTASDMTSERFASIWSHGAPFLVRDLASDPRLWSPQYFMDAFGPDACTVEDCQTGNMEDVTVSAFFKQFSKPSRKASLKLKDWPPTSAFEEVFPELYRDFARTVPAPEYVLRTGIFNLAAHFPELGVPPDLGPKMYNALASMPGSDTRGSTRLHSDIADAVNVMKYSSTADGAVWTIFAAEDSETLSTFLRTHVEGSQTDSTIDPIDGQQHYLTSSMLTTLREKTGLTWWEIVQRTNEAVFIPAGCPHQVLNRSHCVKIAIDFVSPQNIARCHHLTARFRAQNVGEKWKEDVLQLKTMAWHAWVALSH